MAPKTKYLGKIDEQIAESFPASDPPSFMGGEVLGAPEGRTSVARRKNVKRAKRPAAKKRVTRKAPAKKAKKKKTATKRRKAR
ncbi:MAG TPA: hypothetical protein VIJ85_00440 [Rhizomicrobium sp.]